LQRLYGPPILTLSAKPAARSRSSMAEHRFCKPAVVSSTLTASSSRVTIAAEARNWGFAARESGEPKPRRPYWRAPSVGAGPRRAPSVSLGVGRAGRWPSGQWHQTVNLAGYPYGGSNPSLPNPHRRQEPVEPQAFGACWAAGARLPVVPGLRV
jgi:hypothetical protein